jgi:Zn-dependent peptidase ImmA (M78 family)
VRRIPFSFRPAVQAARGLITDLQIRSPDEIDIELIASHCGALVQFGRLAHEDGQLIRSGDEGIIVVDERTRESAKWRFVAAHELGHLLAHRGVDQLRVCTDADLHEWYSSAGHEPAANHFAAELLMPENLFKPLCDRNRPSLRDIRELADAFKTSLMATALRFVDYCPEPVAVAFSVEGSIAWWLKSDDFRFWLKKGHRLGKLTYAGDLFAGKSVDDRPSAVSAEGWSDDSSAEGSEVQEHSMRLGAHGVLSLLWHPYA